mmetsp:Transcript_135846/g.307337  ORF Transcript_135846/g.307337 Transcript_135846/m.307337 type:complete len:543 (-) Transcript_135846:356-1984(-)
MYSWAHHVGLHLFEGVLVVLNLSNGAGVPSSSTIDRLGRVQRQSLPVLLGNFAVILAELASSNHLGLQLSSSRWGAATSSSEILQLLRRTGVDDLKLTSYIGGISLTADCFPLTEASTADALAPRPVLTPIRIRVWANHNTAAEPVSGIWAAAPPGMRFDLTASGSWRAASGLCSALLNGLQNARQHDSLVSCVDAEPIPDLGHVANLFYVAEWEEAEAVAAVHGLRESLREADPWLDSADVQVCAGSTTVHCLLVPHPERPSLVYLAGTYFNPPKQEVQWYWNALRMTLQEATSLSQGFVQAAYVKYHIGLDVPVLQPSCQYMDRSVKYIPASGDVEVVVWTRLPPLLPFWFEFELWWRRFRLRDSFSARALHITFKEGFASWEVFASFGAVILYPHALSLTSLGELVHLEMPIFVPHPDVFWDKIVQTLHIHRRHFWALHAIPAGTGSLNLPGDIPRPHIGDEQVDSVASAQYWYSCFSDFGSRASHFVQHWRSYPELLYMLHKLDFDELSTAVAKEKERRVRFSNTVYATVLAKLIGHV